LLRGVGDRRAHAPRGLRRRRSAVDDRRPLGRLRPAPLADGSATVDPGKPIASGTPRQACPHPSTVRGTIMPRPRLLAAACVLVAVCAGIAKAGPPAARAAGDPIRPVAPSPEVRAMLGDV